MGKATSELTNITSDVWFRFTSSPLWTHLSSSQWRLLLVGVQEPLEEAVEVVVVEEVFQLRLEVEEVQEEAEGEEEPGLTGEAGRRGAWPHGQHLNPPHPHLGGNNREDSCHILL